MLVLKKCSTSVAPQNDSIVDRNERSEKTESEGERERARKRKRKKRKESEMMKKSERERWKRRASTLSGNWARKNR